MPSIRIVLLTILVALSLWQNSSIRASVPHPQAFRTPSIRPSYTFIGSDVPSELPIEYRLVRLIPEESLHYAVTGPEARLEWLWTGMEGNNDAHLGPENRVFIVAMFHELHCLRYANLGDREPQHLHHCLNYLRKWILCSADVTLEPGDFRLRDFQTDRLGVTHTCRDWEHIYSVAQQNWFDWEEFRNEHWDASTGQFINVTKAGRDTT
ncbi:uncharacterized protein B0H18DRAFT_1087885 [Fomitopsis serialis]|uniref:uncharacterized protein n=1 Tax=Fomitopsis serialis TaxID=139415 RepID=UPI0020085542|nr:uncharacterized protein B0H18DRAFT_1087885 [Neoantrodia serialis]KAH9914253.1 hypothetical protein B0H18DRAFT_1087885 [Neoantrodia serialis]